jgi:general secretion pathway protein I
LTGSPVESRSPIDARAGDAGDARRAASSSARHPRAPGRALRASACARGFSLLEVLVAFVILALVGTALFRVFSGALTNVAAADDYSRAVLVAESVLTEAAGVQPLREASQTGTADDARISWTTQVTPYAAPQVNPDIEKASEAMAIRLFRIVAEVTFPAANGKPRTFTLATIRVGARESR